MVKWVGGAAPLLQSYTAAYYVLADLLMLALYFHYKFKKRPSLRECGERGGGRPRSAGGRGLRTAASGPGRDGGRTTGAALSSLGSHPTIVASAVPLYLALGLDTGHRCP